jgi:hypothetical protein
LKLLAADCLVRQPAVEQVVVRLMIRCLSIYLSIFQSGGVSKLKKALLSQFSLVLKSIPGIECAPSL